MVPANEPWKGEAWGLNAKCEKQVMSIVPLLLLLPTNLNWDRLQNHNLSSQNIDVTIRINKHSLHSAVNINENNHNLFERKVKTFIPGYCNQVTGNSIKS